MAYPDRDTFTLNWPLEVTLAHIDYLERFNVFVPPDVLLAIPETFLEDVNRHIKTRKWLRNLKNMPE